VEVNNTKLVRPTSMLERLGVIIDADKMELRMSKKVLDMVKTELRSWIGRKSGTKRQLLSLLGKLVFISRIIKPGRIFMRRLIALSTTVSKLHYKVRLSTGAREDIMWWIECVDCWNCKSVFLEELWVTSVDFHMYTDACGYGIGGVFNEDWFSFQLNADQMSMDISWKELLAVLVACELWGYLLCGRRLLIHCDNSAVVCVVNSGTSKCPHLMRHVRLLFATAVRHNFDVRLKHVPGTSNIEADLLSRLELTRFQRLRASLGTPS
jgi:hypothetical protein